MNHTTLIGTSDTRNALVKELQDKITEAQKQIEDAKLAPAIIKEAQSILRVLGIGVKPPRAKRADGLSVREAVEQTWKDGASVKDIATRIVRLNLSKVVSDPSELHNNIRQALFSMEHEGAIKRQKNGHTVIFVRKVKATKKNGEKKNAA